jgi:dUTP pyrophosphatase
MSYKYNATLPLAIKRLPNAADIDVPVYATDGAAGFDLSAALDAPIQLFPGDRALVPTGFAFAVPPGYEVQIRPRSGAALHRGLTVLNTPGTIDSDYRGEVKVLLFNAGFDAIEVTTGDRIAQGVLCPVLRARFEVVPDLNETARGDGGFGSTGA